MGHLYGAAKLANLAGAVHKYGSRTPTSPEGWRKENRKLAEEPATLTKRKPSEKKKKEK